MSVNYICLMLVFHSQSSEFPHVVNSTERASVFPLLVTSGSVPTTKPVYNIYYTDRTLGFNYERQFIRPDDKLPWHQCPLPLRLLLLPSYITKPSVFYIVCHLHLGALNFSSSLFIVLLF